MTQELSHENEELIELNRQENETKREIEKLHHEIKLLKSELGFTENPSLGVSPFLEFVDSRPEATLRPLPTSGFAQHSTENSTKWPSNEKGTIQRHELPVTDKPEVIQTLVSEKQVTDRIPKPSVQNLSFISQEETLLLSIQGQKRLEIDHKDSHQKIILEFHPHQVKICFLNGTEFKLPLEKL